MCEPQSFCASALPDTRMTDAPTRQTTLANLRMPLNLVNCFSLDHFSDTLTLQGDVEPFVTCRLILCDVGRESFILRTENFECGSSARYEMITRFPLKKNTNLYALWV